jgi:hypothetical protein
MKVARDESLPGQILESASVLGMCFAALAPSKLNTTQDSRGGN